MKRIYWASLFIASLLFCPRLYAEPFGMRDGYTLDVEKEKGEESSEMVLIPPPPRDPPLKERIFSKKLSTEFNEKYRQRFGLTEAEQSYNLPNREFVTQSSVVQRQSAEIRNESERSFGEYVLRRLTEFHIENYAKNEPAVRPAWELKERVSNVKLEVRKGYSFNVKYSLSGNQVDIIFKNPYLDTQANLTMDPDAFGPSTIEERIYRLGYPITKTLYVESYIKEFEESLALIGRKSLTGSMSISLLLSFNTPALESSSGLDREKRYLLGFSWTN